MCYHQNLGTELQSGGQKPVEEEPDLGLPQRAAPESVQDSLWVKRRRCFQGPEGGNFQWGRKGTPYRSAACNGRAGTSPAPHLPPLRRQLTNVGMLQETADSSLSLQLLVIWGKKGTQHNLGALQPVAPWSPSTACWAGRQP